MNVNSQKYYDTIADQYETLLDEFDKHELIRKVVSQKFSATVLKNSRVLDFGGGTGLDLSWLNNDYIVTFWEPSIGMRKLAKQRIVKRKYTNITCIEDGITNFKTLEKITHTHKFDAILGNFAVLNSIKNIEQLATNLSLITSKNCDLFFLILFRYPNVKINFLKKGFLRLIFNLSPYSKTFALKNDQLSHDIHIHSLKYLRKSFDPNFKIVSINQLNNSYFKLLHLKKK